MKTKTNASPTKRFAGEWKTNGAVKKLYDTPLGEVFEFYPTNPFLNSVKGQNRLDNQLNTIQFELYKNSKEQKELKRFIVIDFKIRVFPATVESENPRLYFVLTRSLSSSGTIQKLQGINGQAAFFNYCRLSPPRDLKLTQVYSPKGKDKEKIVESIKIHAHASLGHSFLPAYEIISMRMIIDTNMDGIITSNVNKALHWSLRENSSSQEDYPVRSFGILVTDIEVLGLGKNRKILELSRPQVLLTDSEEEVEKLPPVEFAEYPYEGYMKMYEESKKKKKKRNLKRLDNPDEIYANALHLLKGEDPVEGIDLLTYAAKRKEHILAMNQLGICYWRGIGVDPNPEKALVWFRKAGEYYLPDALAYGGALALQRTAKPYINDHNKKYVSRALNKKLRYNGGKHSTVVFAAILGHGGLGAQSPKAGYWKAVKRLLPTYNGQNITEDEEAKKIIDEAVAAKFPAAIYFKGQFMIAEAALKAEKMKPVLEQAMALFKLGEQLGDLECAIEVMHCKARLGQLKPEDFDTESYVKFSDHPLYYLLQYAVKNPEAPGVKEFLAGDFRAARSIWEKNLNDTSHFLLALEGIYQYFHYGANTVMSKMYNEDIGDIKDAYRHLDAAAKANIRDAVYLKGVYLLNQKHNSFSSTESGDRTIGVNLLRKLVPQNIKAQYYIIKNNFYNNKSFYKEYLQQLKPLRDSNFPDAWLLSSDILARLYRGNVKKQQNVIGAYKKTASLGSVRALERLATLYYKNGHADAEAKAMAEKYWKKFLEADEKQRRNDPWDPYWPKPKPYEVIVPRSDGTMPVSIYGKREDPDGYKILYRYLEKRYKLKPDKVNDDRFQILKGGPRELGPISGKFELNEF
jgi:hypothetical protein